MNYIGFQVASYTPQCVAKIELCFLPQVYMLLVHDLNFSITSLEHELSQPSCTIFSNSGLSNQEFSNLKMLYKFLLHVELLFKNIREWLDLDAIPFVSLN